MNPATLRMLIERAKSESQNAQALHGNLRRSEEQARAHLAMLRQYTQEYEDRGRVRSGDERDPSADRNQVAFLVRLGQAVSTQEQEVRTREQAAAAAAQAVARCLQRQKSLEALDLRRVQAEQRVQARRDQKSTDEFAQRSGERAAALGLQRDAGSAGRES